MLHVRPLEEEMCHQTGWAWRTGPREQTAGLSGLESSCTPSALGPQASSFRHLSVPAFESGKGVGIAGLR